MTKYNAQKTVINGIHFDSRLEATRFQQLLILEKAGEISDLQLQVEFQVLKGWKHPETGEKTQSIKYIADFVYWDIRSKRWIAEDTKGVETPGFRIKWALAQTQYREYEFRKVKKGDI